MNTAPGWWARNWKWVVPSGCLTILVVFFGGIALILSFVFAVIKESDVYTLALAEARESPAVTDALGTPLEAGYFVSGSIKQSGGSGQAQMGIPLSGPIGEGTLYLEAHKTAGRWRFSALVLRLDGSEQEIDLLLKDGQDSQE